MTLSVVLSLAAPLLTGVVAVLWAGLVAPGLDDGSETAAPHDPRAG